MEKSSHKERLVQFICPICKKEKEIGILESIVSNSKALTTISIQNKIPIFLVGNKSDQIDKIVLSEKELGDFASKFDFDFYLTSAKTGQNVEELFVELAGSFFEYQRI